MFDFLNNQNWTTSVFLHLFIFSESTLHFHFSWNVFHVDWILHNCYNDYRTRRDLNLFNRQRYRQNDGTAKWYKFDDGDVTECKMEEEEEMKSQCFGGDYLGEVFDHMLKRMSYRKQKRWWNAYMLFYTRLDVEENSLMKSVNELSLCKYSLYGPWNFVDRFLCWENVSS